MVIKNFGVFRTQIHSAGEVILKSKQAVVLLYEQDGCTHAVACLSSSNICTQYCRVSCIDFFVNSLWTEFNN